MGLIKGYHPKGFPTIFPMNISPPKKTIESKATVTVWSRVRRTQGTPSGCETDSATFEEKSQQTSPPEQRKKNNPDSQGYF